MPGEWGITIARGVREFRMKTSGVIAALVCGIGLASGASAQATDPLSEKAAVYVDYVSQATSLDGRTFKNATELNDVLSSMGSYKGDQIGTGWVAYSALIAAKEPEYRKAVRTLSANYGTDVTAQNIADRKWSPVKLDGGEAALKAVIETTEADFASMNNGAAHMREQYYVLEKFGWGKAIIGQKDKNQRLSNILSLRTAGRAPDPALVTRISESRSLLSETNAAALTSAGAGFNDAVSAIKLPAMFQPAPKPAAKATTFTTAFNEIPKVIMGSALLDILAQDAGSTMSPATMIDKDLATPTSDLKALNNKLVTAVMNLDVCVAAVRTEADLSFCVAADTIEGLQKKINETMD